MNPYALEVVSGPSQAQAPTIFVLIDGNPAIGPLSLAAARLLACDLNRAIEAAKAAQVLERCIDLGIPRSGNGQQETNR